MWLKNKKLNKKHEPVLWLIFKPLLQKQWNYLLLISMRDSSFWLRPREVQHDWVFLLPAATEIRFLWKPTTFLGLVSNVELFARWSRVRFSFSTVVIYLSTSNERFCLQKCDLKVKYKALKKKEKHSDTFNLTRMASFNKKKNWCINDDVVDWHFHLPRNACKDFRVPLKQQPTHKH